MCERTYCDNCNKTIKDEKAGIWHDDPPRIFCCQACYDEWLEEGVMYIECPKCGNSEGMDADEQRHHSQHFEWLENDDTTDYPVANFKCYCGEIVKSRFMSNREDS